MKISTIRNELIKYSIINSVILAVIGGLVMYAVSVDEECDTTIRNTKSAADRIANEAVQLSTGFGHATSIMTEFKEIKEKLDNKLLIISKDSLRDVISNSRSKYIVDSLDVKIDTITPFVVPEVVSDKVSLESSNVSINLSAISDIDVLGLIEDMDRAFWGLKTNSLEFYLSKELDNNALIEISDTGFSPVVNAKVSITMFGFHDNSKNISESLTNADPNAVNKVPGQP